MSDIGAAQSKWYRAGHAAINPLFDIERYQKASLGGRGSAYGAVQLARDRTVGGLVTTFLFEKFLFWIELLCLYNCSCTHGVDICLTVRELSLLLGHDTVSLDS